MKEKVEIYKEHSNLIKAKNSLELFKETCPELFEQGRLKYFHFFYCPISVALADADEFTREEYESTEKLILHLYAAGLKKSEAISKVTGLDIKLVTKILDIETNAYGHIKDGQVTETGRASLNDNYNHYIYEVQKEIQFEAVTGTVLDRDIEQKKDKLLKGLNPNFHRAVPLNEVDVSVTKDIIERLEEYKSLEKSVIDKNIKQVKKVTTHILRFIYAYVVSFDYLPDPFIVLGGRIYLPEEKKSRFIIKPTAISESNAEILQNKNIKVSSYNVRRDDYFDYLKDVIGSFEIDESEIDLIENVSIEQTNTAEDKEFILTAGAEEFNEAIELREDIEEIKITPDEERNISEALVDLKGIPERT